MPPKTPPSGDTGWPLARCRARTDATCYLVNRRSPTVLGQRCATRISELPEVPELVALCVPAAHVDAVVDEALERGVRGFLGITAGIADDTALAAKITAHGARLIGTNSLGIYDATHRAATDVGQSRHLARWRSSRRAGSSARSWPRSGGATGSASPASSPSATNPTSRQRNCSPIWPPTTRPASSRCTWRASPTASRSSTPWPALRSAGKPTVLLTVGASNASARLARTHTGSLTSPLDVVDAACRAAGVVRVNTPTDVVDVARSFLAAPVPGGRRVAIVGDSGGQSGIAADVAAAAGLTVPQFPDALVEPTSNGGCRQGPRAPTRSTWRARGSRTCRTTPRSSSTSSPADGVDAVVMTGYFGCYGQDTPALADAEVSVAERLGAVVSATGVPVVVHTMAPESATAQALWQHGVPAFGRIEAAMRVLAALGGSRADHMHRRAAHGVEHRAGRSRATGRPRAVLSEVGVAFPSGALVRTAADLDEATGRSAGAVRAQGRVAGAQERSRRRAVNLARLGAGSSRVRRHARPAR